MTEQENVQEEKKKKLPEGYKTGLQVYEEQQMEQEKKEAQQSEEQAKFVEFERKDELLIEKEMQGEVLKTYFYQFTQKGRTITGLSIIGLREVIRRMGNIHTQKPEIEDKGDYWICKTEVIDRRKNIRTWGISQQSKKLTYQDGTAVDDPMSLQKCYSKSWRNAARQLVPEKLITKMYEEWQKDEKKRQTDSKQFM